MVNLVEKCLLRNFYEAYLKIPMRHTYLSILTRHVERAHGTVAVSTVCVCVCVRVCERISGCVCMCVWM